MPSYIPSLWVVYSIPAIHSWLLPENDLHKEVLEISIIYCLPCSAKSWRSSVHYLVGCQPWNSFIYETLRTVRIYVVTLLEYGFGPPIWIKRYYSVSSGLVKCWEAHLRVRSFWLVDDHPLIRRFHPTSSLHDSVRWNFPLEFTLGWPTLC